MSSLSEQELREKVQTLQKRRDSANQTLNQYKAKYDLAVEQRSKLEQECRDQGIDPAQIEQALADARAKLERALDEAEKSMSSVEQQLQTYSKG